MMMKSRCVHDNSGNNNNNNSAGAAVVVNGPNVVGNSGQQQQQQQRPTGKCCSEVNSPTSPTNPMVSAMMMPMAVYHHRPNAGHCDLVISMMAHHPNYLEPFIKTHNFILRGDGPLSYAVRHYIAIMAAARHQCNHLVNAERDEFLAHGGDQKWLQGIGHIPKKLRDINEINKILAHQPWLLTKGHIEKLTKGADSWSLSELVHAIVIMTHFHALSSFVFSGSAIPGLAGSPGSTTGSVGGSGAGAGPEDEKENGGGHNCCNGAGNATTTNNLLRETSSSSSTGVGDGNDQPDGTGSPTDNGQQLGSSPSGSDTNVDVLMKKMQTITEQQLQAATDQDELAKQFTTVGQQSAQLAVPNGNSPPRSPMAVDQSANQLSQVEDTSVFVEDAQFVYQDFATRNRRCADDNGVNNDVVPTFRIQDYSWDDHGYSLVNRLYNDVGNLLDEKFKVCYNLTYYTMGRRANVDTSTFRRAVWNYIQCVYGIRHDDYDYREVNELLERNLKTYIKTLCCFPHRVQKCNSNFKDVMSGFRRSEKIHVNLMIFEARLQAELLYALRAVMRYMT